MKSLRKYHYLRTEDYKQYRADVEEAFRAVKQLNPSWERMEDIARRDSQLDRFRVVNASSTRKSKRHSDDFAHASLQHRVAEQHHQHGDILSELMRMNPDTTQHNMDNIVKDAGKRMAGRLKKSLRRSSSEPQQQQQAPPDTSSDQRGSLLKSSAASGAPRE